MRTGVFLDCLRGWALDDALSFLAQHNVQCLEVGTFGEYVAFEYRLDDLLADGRQRKELLNRVEAAGLEITAFGCYGNPLHPDAGRALRQQNLFTKTVELAALLGVPTVTEFAGCPGDSEQARFPNWISILALDDFAKILDWQWSERVLPYWERAGAFCADHDVQVALELYPGSVVFNPSTLLRLRDAIGPVVGALVDPSHLFWQQIDVPGAVRYLGPAVHRVHMNDSQLRTHRLAEVGVLSPVPGADWTERPWVHRTLGFGHGAEFWKDFVSSVVEIGYSADLCIEQGDPLYDDADGIAKAAALIRSIAPSN
ncbi:sugar phosphate isomerase/epimerase [Kribbella antiqua]|uniref:Sugar phosphate isomerase/epimerase n=1 Tax=Kribbella antiqua TaxID=2512217 RepID=A0A4R2IX92_9ACTN|nr:sugar phosphate isomerase/epimerase [Kribbella antiqua]TCO50403.1 sugar phosphate isomerase/epimerase [Kribbella antiqua]